MPPWVTGARDETPEDLAFLSGAALSALHLVLVRAEVPQALLRARMALRAAETCVGLSGRRERAGELRDAVHLMRAGDLPGPAGAVYQQWRSAGARRISAGAVQKALPEVDVDDIAGWLGAGPGAPVGRSAEVLQAVLAQNPRADLAALILADAALARRMGWTHVVPLLSPNIKSRDLRKTGEELRQACHRVVRTSCAEAIQLATDLARRAARLNAVAPKLRAKGAARAVEMFLSRDAVAPSDLRSFMSDRAARRLCDRLVELGVVRELTGRDTFRLYGV
ncbi:hypothetical protein P775_01025 [Puniceibacterium antarcticum]|uniref:DUF1403 family protein n=2 Tax=Puniceibacterium antarcticum TaxID=1206336 RepID=A0A2G8RKI8_9RHOB|nr:hypothetical protein P775_01025 [Puniceibacterium antarcticum]